MKRAALLCLALLCLPAAARAYDPAALAADSAAFSRGLSQLTFSGDAGSHHSRAMPTRTEGVP